jgi:hypothetical protein
MATKTEQGIRETLRVTRMLIITAKAKALAIKELVTL